MKKANFWMLGILALFLLLPLAHAIDLSQPISASDLTTFNQILDPVLKIYNLVKYVATAIAALVLLISGVSYIIGGSDPKKRDNAKATAMYVIIGLVIIWAAPLVVNFIVG